MPCPNWQNFHIFCVGNKTSEIGGGEKNLNQTKAYGICLGACGS
jgi:hypothetical protein